MNKPLQDSAGNSTLQSRVFSLQSTKRGIPSGSKQTPPSQKKQLKRQTGRSIADSAPPGRVARRLAEGAARADTPFPRATVSCGTRGLARFLVPQIQGCLSSPLRTVSSVAPPETNRRSTTESSFRRSVSVRRRGVHAEVLYVSRTFQYCSALRDKVSFSAIAHARSGLSVYDLRVCTSADALRTPHLRGARPHRQVGAAAGARREAALHPDLREQAPHIQ